ncbi:MAG: Fic family protein [Butyricicoccus sp.]|nr:Fic family protein [Butyricicoccus sp.]MCM1232982.1 Fic family protein [Ruminococcus flavefaciens]
MKYPELRKMYYKDRDGYEQECAMRPESAWATVLPLEINGYKSYYMNCPEITGLICEIYKNYIVLKKTVDRLPSIAYDCYKRNCLIDEVMMTNDLEGVHSTKREISEILDATQKESKKAMRLRGMVVKYEKLLSGSEEVIELKNSRDIRKLYDELVIDEMAKEDLPDGEIFRKGPVSVVSATDKEKHRGLPPPEKNIIDSMDKALEVINLGEFPVLIGIAALHYYIGYIHPFYDGNGRLNRFISSYLLSMHLGTLVGLRLAYTIKNEKNLYYSAFDFANNKKNRGDITPFIIIFLKIVNDSIIQMLRKVWDGEEKFVFYANLFDRLKPELDGDSHKILVVLIQDKIFGSGKFDIKGLAEVMEYGYSKMRKELVKISESTMERLLKRSREGHRYIYSIDLDALEEMAEKAGNER